MLLHMRPHMCMILKVLMILNDRSRAASLSGHIIALSKMWGGKMPRF